jgi:hypothetical protein
VNALRVKSIIISTTVLMSAVIGAAVANTATASPGTGAVAASDITVLTAPEPGATPWRRELR